MKQGAALPRFQMHTTSMEMTDVTTTDGTRPFCKRFDTDVLRFTRA